MKRGGRWLVTSDCLLRGQPVYWGQVLELDSETALALQMAGRITAYTPAKFKLMAQTVERLLSPRERQVIELADLVNKQIADRLGINTGTVRKHWQSLMRKMHRPGRVGAALFWYRVTRTR
jgi:DNA-binding NarL/FixJ family response regulator